MRRLNIGKILLLAAAIFLWLSGSSYCRVLECEIIQLKLDRFYFSAGTEQDIFSGSSFEIVFNDSAVYEGKIESAFLGVSFSEPTGFAFNTLLLDSCHAILDLPDIDSITQIELSFLNMNPASLLSQSTELGDSAGDATGDTLLRSLYGNPIVAQRIEAFDLDYISDGTHGLFSFSSPALSLNGGSIRASSPAPFVAVLIPNLSRKMNENGLLTTSLYYRFSGENLRRIFAGDSVEFFPSGFLFDSSSPRPYPYHPATGRALLSNYRHRPERIRIGLSDASLKSVADYFADVLSRDRIRVEFVETQSESDLWLDFIPLSSSDPTSSLKSIMEVAVSSGKPRRRLSESIQLVNQRLTAAGEADSMEVAIYFCKLADRAMKEDLGIFPLFRPRLYLSTDKMLKDASFDSAGYFVHDRLILLTLPAQQEKLK